eukprot:6187637-Pleurochrysis_carterae.AAC.3
MSWSVVINIRVNITHIVKNNCKDRLNIRYSISWGVGLIISCVEFKQGSHEFHGQKWQSRLDCSRFITLAEVDAGN